MGVFFQKPFAVSSQPTVDGRNPANQLICSLSHYLRGFWHLRWFSRRISEPSTVWIFCWCSSMQPTNLPSTYRCFLAPPTLKPPHHLGRVQPRVSSTGWLNSFWKDGLLLNSFTGWVGVDFLRPFFTVSKTYIAPLQNHGWKETYITFWNAPSQGAC